MSEYVCQMWRRYVGEVGALPKMGQSRKSRLRGNDKTWKPPIGNVVKLKLTQSLNVNRKMMSESLFAMAAKLFREVRFLISVYKLKVVIFHR